MTAWSGTLPTIAGGAVILGSDIDTVRDAVGGVTDVWTDYTPVWAASGTAVALNNGTITGRYIRSGKLVVAEANLTMGSTTTFGTGNYTITLPITARAGATPIGAALMYDASSDANRRPGAAVLSGTGAVSFFADGTVGQLAPFTWANGDIIRFTITYEAA